MSDLKHLSTQELEDAAKSSIKYVQQLTKDKTRLQKDIARKERYLKDVSSKLSAEKVRLDWIRKYHHEKTKPMQYELSL